MHVVHVIICVWRAAPRVGRAFARVGRVTRRVESMALVEHA